MRKLRMSLYLITTAMVLVSCSGNPNGRTLLAPTASTSTTPTFPFGSATVQPDILKVGAAFTVTPSSEIEPICLQIVDIYTRAEPPRFVGALGPGGTWQANSESTPVTYPPCQPNRSRDAETLTLRAEGLPAGDYVVCVETLALDRSLRERAGCGPVTVPTG
jgi:hypothetical protein